MTDSSLKSLFIYFLKLGLTGFGGPIALIQQMRLDLTEKKSYLSEKEFDQAFTMVKAMPGPVAFQMAVYIGVKLGRFAGGCLAGFGIIAPAFFMMVALAYYYEFIIQNPYLARAMQGAQYAVASIILIGLYKLSKTYHQKIVFWCFVLFTAVSFYFKWLPETVLILGSGLVLVLFSFSSRLKNKMMGFAFLPFLTIDSEKVNTIFRVCLETGALVFGTGLAAFPFLESAFVSQRGWMDLKTFNDAVSLGQMTPGPVTIAATFMGYKMAAMSGAVAATVGLYLPAFVHMTTWFPKALNWLSKQRWIDSFILGSTAAVVGCVFITVLNMNSADISRGMFWFIFSLATFLQFKFKNLSVLLIIFIGAIVNLLFNL